ncbi:MAG: hypothetical protein IH787_03785 [Nitrospirae bacterium]|nr:hypothetical protein [Nitrospirota bacterium]
MDLKEMVAIVKAQIDTSITAGTVSAQDASEFIDLSREQTQILDVIRVETGIRKSLNLDTLTLGEPVIIAGVEGTEPAAGDVVAAGRSRATLTPIEILAAFDVTYSWLRKAITHAARGISEEEGRRRAMQALNKLFAKRFGKDVVMIAFNGDTALPDDTRTNKALRVLDGFIVQMQADATVQDYTIPGSPSYNSQVFPAMLNAMPKDYKDDRDELGFFVSANVYDGYAMEIGSRATALGDMLLAGPWQRNLSYLGIKLYPVFGLADGKIILTPQENLAVGFGQDMTQESERKPRARKVEVTITAELDAKYAVGDAVVLGDDGS